MTEAEMELVPTDENQADIGPEAEESVQTDQVDTEVRASTQSNQEDSSSKNWRETRQALKEQQRMIRELKEQLTHRQPPPEVKHEIDELSNLAKDDLLTRSQAERLAELKARQIIEETLSRREAATSEERIRLKYPDFDEILTESNIEYLRKNKPSLVRSVLSNPDPYAQAEAAYELAKVFCPENQEDRVQKENMKKIAENQAKPVSSNAVKKSSSALDQAHAYTSDRVLSGEGRDHYYKQMLQAKKQAR